MPIPNYSIAVLDVGHGNSAVLHDNDRTVIIDAGPKSGLLEYLIEQQIIDIDLVLISHADADHIGGLIALISSGEFNINRVYLNTDSHQGSKLWDSLLFALDESNINFFPALTVANNGQFDNNRIQIQILGPSGYLAGKGPGSTDRDDNVIRTNSISAIIRISFEEEPIIILPGDLDNIGLNDLVYHDTNISSPVVVFPHHGGNVGGNIIEFTKSFIHYINPKTIIFSTKRGGNPLPQIIQTIRRDFEGARIICTELSNNCSANLPDFEITHLHEVFSLGRSKKQCCSGTIIINLEDFTNIYPCINEHNEFINRAAPTNMCIK